ncbi:MAG TPA: hypothetical protein HPP77_06745 [Candidatus Hydrogenedentes bacterium]|nr:hypothetical protein [Candidatus Hydrogenedentota bacterium]HIJ74763.1 hypothetical protein [Candidatus Hydrogenedentota bacterium]
MKTLQWRPILLLVVAATTLATLSAQGQDFLHARVSYDAGGGMVKGREDAAWSHASINTLILPGDVLWVDDDGFFELEMSGGTFLRMADGSKAEILSLPPEATVRAWTGAFYVHRIRRSTGDVRIDTPACKVDVEKDALARIDVLANGATTVTVRWGQATVETAGGGRVVLKENQRTYVDPGLLPSVPVPADQYGQDAFDAWNSERVDLLRRAPEAPKVFRDAPPIGGVDLALYGDWIYMDGGDYWRPTVVVDYVPYRHGHWSYVPACGYVWVGAYPFSYVTCHYGRWVYKPHYGWLWTYRDVWSPAWVAAVRCGPSFVWCPLDPWDRPVTVTTSVSYSVGGLYLSMAAASYCLADDLLFGPSVVYACTPNIVTGIGGRDVWLWDICAPTYRGRRAGIRGPAARTRDYTPRRVIRGPDTIGPDKQTVASRIDRLETDRGRDRYEARITKPLRIQTSRDESRRSARMHTVRVDEPPVTPPESGGRRALEMASYTPPERETRASSSSSTASETSARTSSRVVVEPGDGPASRTAAGRSTRAASTPSWPERPYEAGTPIAARTPARTAEPAATTPVYVQPDRTRATSTSVGSRAVRTLPRAPERSAASTSTTQAVRPRTMTSGQRTSSNRTAVSGPAPDPRPAPRQVTAPEPAPSSPSRSVPAPTPREVRPNEVASPEVSAGRTRQTAGSRATPRSSASSAGRSRRTR